MWTRHCAWLTALSTRSSYATADGTSWWRVATPVDTVHRVLMGSIAKAVLERAEATVAMVPEVPTA